jgi:hypothetical protein
MTKRLLTNEEKQADPRIPSIAKVFPEFDCYDDGTWELNESKIPPGFAYAMKKSQDAYTEIKEIGIGEYLKRHSMDK